MGAGKPQFRQKHIETPETRPWVFLGAFLFMAALGLSLAVYFSGKNEAPRLSSKDELRLQKRLREIDDSEQYALVAKVNGWYPCLHSGRTIAYLRAGEVWKYGVTSKGEMGRYSAKFLFKNKVFYIIQFKGNYAECLKQEQIKLFGYPYLPENLVRAPADRLPRPPYNRITR